MAGDLSNFSVAPSEHWRS